MAQSASSGSSAKWVPLQNGSDDGAPAVGFEVGAAIAEGIVDALADAVACDVDWALAEAGGAVVTGASPLDDSCEHAAKKTRTKKRFIFCFFPVCQTHRQ